MADMVPPWCGSPPLRPWCGLPWKFLKACLRSKDGKGIFSASLGESLCQFQLTSGSLERSDEAGAFPAGLPPAGSANAGTGVEFAGLHLTPPAFDRRVTQACYTATSRGLKVWRGVRRKSTLCSGLEPSTDLPAQYSCSRPAPRPSAALPLPAVGRVRRSR